MRLKRRASRPPLIALGLIVGSGVAFATLRWLPRAALHRVIPRSKATRAVETSFDQLFEPTVRRVTIINPVAQKIVAAAHAQEGDFYNASYKRIAYPNGDVPRGAGACTDVVIRSLRAAGVDLQKLIHEDMTRDFGRYGNKWKLGHTDTNIDHRRVPNQRIFFEKYAQNLPTDTTGAALDTWQPGDIAIWKLEGGKWHTGIVSDGIGTSGQPLVIHNALMCAEQDYLTNWPIVGHFRFPKSPGN